MLLPAADLFIAIDIGHFGDPAVIRASAARAADGIRTSKRASGVERIFAPGEIEWQTRKSAHGDVKLSGAVAATLVRLAGELNAPVPPVLKSKVNTEGMINDGQA
jgi:LDH2 family malate/lactate/ureidoglycolate dehydrogenase